MTDKTMGTNKKADNCNTKKGKVIFMRHFINKYFMMTALAMVMLMGAVITGNTVKADAATKCYTIGTSNVQVYSNTGLTAKYGAIYSTDEITVNLVKDAYCQVTYPVSRGTKTGYIKTSNILTKTIGSTYKSRAKITTYKRPGGNSYGYIAVGDSVKILGTYGSYTQIKYPVSGGYKYAFITTNNYNSYLAPQNTVVSTPTPTTSTSGYTTSIVKISYYGQVVDTFNGVSARYIPKTGNSNTGTYCCARYVSNYYSQVYGITVSNMFTGRTPAASRGYFYTTSNPQPGDVGYQLNGSNSGHWFIIKAVNGDGTYTVIEQNWKWMSGSSTYCYVNRKVSYSTKGFKVYRWSGR